MATSRLSVFPFSRLTPYGLGDPEACVSRSFSVIARVIDLLEKRPEFQFHVENCGLVAAYISQTPEATKALQKGLESGRLEIGAMWGPARQNTNHGEALVRGLIRGVRFLQSLSGKSAEELAVHLGDVSGLTPQFPQLATACGLRRGTVVDTDRGPFRWQSLDGSHLDMWRLPEGRTGIAGESPGEVRNAMMRSLDSEAPLMLGGPLAVPSEGELDVLLETAEGNSFDIAFCTPRVLAETGCDGPLRCGDGPSAFPSLEPLHPGIAADYIKGAHTLARAEQFTAASSMLCGTPPETFEADWSVYEGDLSEGSNASWEWRRRKLKAALRAADRLGVAARLLAARVRPAEGGPEGTVAIVVFNALSWHVSDCVVADVSLYGESDPADFSRYDQYRIVSGDGEPVAFQELEGRQLKTAELRVAFIAKDVPPNGFATYYLVPHTSEADGVVPIQSPGMMSPEFPEPTFAIEDVEESVTPAYRGLRVGRRFQTTAYDVAVDEVTGHVRIHDRRSDRTILKGIRLEGREETLEGGELRYHHTGRTFEADVDRVELEESGEVRATLLISGRLLTSPFELRFRMYGELDRIDVDLRLCWRDPKPVRVQLVFPVEMLEPSIHYGVPFGSVGFSETTSEPKGDNNPIQDEATGKRQREVVGWVSVDDEGGGIVIGTDRSAFEFVGSEIRSDILRSCPDPSSYAYHRVWRSYPASVTARYTIRSHDADYRTASSACDGWAIHQPLLTSSVYDTISPKTLPDRLSFLNLAGEGLVTTALKCADEGDGFVLRAYESAGRASVGKLVAFSGIQTVNAADPLELPGDVLDPESIPFRPFEIRTFRVQLKDLV